MSGDEFLFVKPDDGEIRLYTDGGYRSTLGIGACAFVAVYKDEYAPYTFSVSYKRTTSNRMELRGAIEALKWARRKLPQCSAAIVTDSRYLNGIPEWAVRWRANGWKTANKNDVKNRDLVKAYLSEIERANSFSSEWIPGHSGNMWNELADTLAGIAIEETVPIEDWRDEYQYGESNE